LEDAQGRLWIGSGGAGVSKFEPKTGKFKTYLDGSYITSLLEDSRGILWVGARNGFYRFDQSSDAFLPFSDPQTGKKIAKVSLIIEDDQKALWVLTQSSLIRLNAKRDRLSVYGNGFGIKQDNRRSYEDAVKTDKGEILFVDADGALYSFFPDGLKGNDFPALIAFTNLNFSEESGKGVQDVSINSSLATNQKLKLNHDQNVFSIDYAVMHYSSPEDNQHYYMLENYDKDWRQGGADQRGYYFKVPPGQYVFKVKAASYNGIWSQKSISITILPPWWRTWWAYTIYSVLFITGVLGVHRYQKQKVIASEREKAQKKELAQAKEIERAYHELKTTQQQLIQSEKMASLGELTAGIAHEIQNPLNFVNNFSEVNNELIEEMNNESDISEIKTIANDIKQNNEKIAFHGKRADAIVKGMLQHSRISTGKKEPTDINALADEYLRLSYHGMRAKDKGFNATLKTDFDTTIGKINVVPQEIGRVMLNLCNNAFYAVLEKKKQASDSYEPALCVTTKKVNSKVEIHIKDNGPGIPQKVADKIFQPFFTTKPTGQGTGLGLSLSYDIIKAHGGEIKVESKEAEGSEFIICIPYL
jgi:signal transduction histidine kinase